MYEGQAARKYLRLIVIAVRSGFFHENVPFSKRLFNLNSCNNLVKFNNTFGEISIECRPFYPLDSQNFMAKHKKSVVGFHEQSFQWPFREKSTPSNVF